MATLMYLLGHCEGPSRHRSAEVPFVCSIPSVSLLSLSWKHDDEFGHHPKLSGFRSTGTRFSPDTGGCGACHDAVRALVRIPSKFKRS